MIKVSTTLISLPLVFTETTHDFRYRNKIDLVTFWFDQKPERLDKVVNLRLSEFRQFFQDFSLPEYEWRDNECCSQDYTSLYRIHPEKSNFWDSLKARFCGWSLWRLGISFPFHLPYSDLFRNFWPSITLNFKVSRISRLNNLVWSKWKECKKYIWLIIS